MKVLFGMPQAASGTVIPLDDCGAIIRQAVDNALAKSTIGLFKTEVINLLGHGKPSVGLRCP
jgi:hypothetical protein